MKRLTVKEILKVPPPAGASVALVPIKGTSHSLGPPLINSPACGTPQEGNSFTPTLNPRSFAIAQYQDYARSILNLSSQAHYL